MHLSPWIAVIATAFIAASCSMPVSYEDAKTRAVSGRLLLPADVELPADADVVVTFRGLGGDVLAEERSRVEGRDAPYPFNLPVPTDRIGTVVGRVEESEGTTWQSVSVLLDEGPASVELGTLVLDPADPAWAAAAGTAGPRSPTAEAAGEQLALALAGIAPRAEGAPEPAAAPAAPQDGSLGRELQAEPQGEAATSEAGAPAANGRTQLSCGESQITVTEANGGADVRVGETVVEMQETEAAGGGRRYAVPDDPATYLSLDGGAVEVSFAGVILSDCTVASQAE